jgi:hypothetical protein
MASAVGSRPTSLSSRRVFWPVLSLVALLAITIFFLYSQGRYWICTCGFVKVWAGDIYSFTDNSQHIFDPYSFSHVQHGLLFYMLVAWLLPRLRLGWQFFTAMAIEAGWEMFENSSIVIRRYQQTTISDGYSGDTILNSFSDLVLCGVGFWIAHWLGFRRTVVLFVVIEVAMILWIRDSMLLNILMLVFPVEAVRNWQLGL